MKSLPCLLVWSTLAALSSVGLLGQVPDLRTRSDGEDWPRFLGPRGDGKSVETGILTSWPESGPPLAWDQAVGEGYSMPSTSKGRLFLFDRAENRMRLRCLKSETGEELWRSEYPTDYRDYYGYSGGPRANPVVDGDRVYTFGVGGRLRCHSVVDGDLLWEVDTTEKFSVVQNFFGTGSSPIVEGSLLIALIGGSAPDSPPIHSGQVRGNGSGIVAFDKLTGAIRYQVTDELASYSSPQILTLGNRRLVVVLARGGLVAFDPRDGAVEAQYPWRARQLESVNAATPMVVDETIFITESYGLGGCLLKARPGGFDVLWKDPPRRGQSLASHFGTPLYHKGVLYGCSGRYKGMAEMRAVDHKTGKVLWSQPGLGWTSLLYADGHLIALGDDGRLHLFEATPASPLLKTTVTLKDDAGRPLLKPPAWNHPILSQGLLYARGRDRLVALRLIPDPSKDN